MKTKNILLMNVMLITLVAGCATKPVALAPVGPRPGDRTSYVSTGHLRVYSGTKTREIAENTIYYPHTAYTIAKFGMSMVVLGLAGELRAKGIAVYAKRVRGEVEGSNMVCVKTPCL